MKTRLAGVFLIVLFLGACSQAPTVPLSEIKVEVDANGAEPAEIVSWFQDALSGNLNIPDRNVRVTFLNPSTLSVELPSSMLEEANAFLKMCAECGGVSFAEVHPKSSNFDGENPETPEGWQWMAFRDEPQRKILVEGDPSFDEGSIESAEPFHGPNGWSLSVNFTPPAVKEMMAFTTRLVDERVAIIVGDQVISAPVVREPFSTGAAITGDFTQEEIAALEAFLNRPDGIEFSVK